jgi:hypothetical protein
MRLLFLQDVRTTKEPAVAISDPKNPSRYFQVRGRVLSVTTAGAVEHIEMLAQKYLGKP